MGKHSEAIRLCSEAMETQKQVFGTKNPIYAKSLGDLAGYYSDSGNYAEAIRLGTEAMEIRKKALGMEHPLYAQSLNNLASYYSYNCNFAEAIRLCGEAMEIQKKVFGTKNPAYAMSLCDLAGYKLCLGHFTEALSLCNEAMEINTRGFGVDHPSYAKILNKAVVFYGTLGKYSEAIRLCGEAMEIQKKALGTKNRTYATSLECLAGIYSIIGNNPEAIHLYGEAMEIQKQVLGTRNPYYASTLGFLSNCYSNIGNYAEAIRLGTEAIEIKKEVLGTKHPNYAMSLIDLANYYSALGNNIEAIRLCNETMKILKQAFGTEHTFYAKPLPLLARCYSNLGNNTEAIRLCTEAMEIQKHFYGAEHPFYAQLLNNLAGYHARIGKFEKAFFYISNAANTSQNYLLSQFSSMTSHQRQQYWNSKQQYTFLSLPNYAMKSGQIESASIVYDKSCLFAKGLLLSADTEMRNIILESGDEQALSKFEELQATRAWLGKLYEKPIAERQVSTDSLERVAERQEAELVQMSAAYGDFMRNLKLTWKDVQAKLGDKDIAVEFLSFPLMGTDSTMYIALTLKKGYNNPRMIPLFELHQLKDIKTSYYKSPELSTMLWGKLADELEGVQNVYFSPSGELYNIGIESMPDYNGSGSMLNERFNFYRLSSTRELATTKRDAKEASGATIYGGINYNTDVAHMGTPHKEDGQIYAFNRGFEADSAGLRGSQIGSLAGTLEESNKIDSILTAAHVQVDKLTGDNATETSLKNMSGKHKRIMHIATHGFYWSESEAEKTNTQKQLKFLMLDNDDNPRYVEDKAMTRSGLLFCGAQNTFNGDAIPEGVDDGVLTAQEISQIDLRGLDLLVLSACQTGLGEISGDGVFGLQRGFKKAGAQTIVMSLWKVNDAATRDLMVQFYTGLADGLTKRQAFLKAQIYLKDHDKTYPYTYKMRNNPHWAAFILLDALQ